jgi:hypothetical protein
MDTAEREPAYDYIARRLKEDEGNAKDSIENPNHYTRYKIQPASFIIRNNMEFWRGNIIKYASRAGYKIYPNTNKLLSEISDLRKVIRYAEMRINQLEGKTEL